MAVHHLPILGAATMPDPAGGVYPEPLSVNFQSNDRYPGMCFAFPDSGTRIKLGGSFRVPQNYVGTAKIGLVWATTATTGDLRSEFDYTAIADGETLDPNSDQESVAATTTMPGTARFQKVVEIALTSSNFAVADLVQFSIVRDGGEAADTLAATAYLIAAYFSYADA